MQTDWLRSFRFVSLATVCSRLSGYVRDAALGLWIGPGPLLDAYFLVTRIASFGRAFFAEGMVNALVPVLTREPDRHAQYQLMSACALRIACLVGALCLWVSAYPKTLLMWLTPGFAHDDRMVYAVSLLSLIFWYLFQISMIAVWNALLHVQGYFLGAAMLPIILNLALTVAAYGLGRWHWPYQSLGYAVLMAGAIQWWVVMWLVWRASPGCRGTLCVRHPRVRALYEVLVGAFASTGAVQCSSLIDAVLASSLRMGAVSWVYYADRLIQLPLGVFGASMMTVLLPKLAGHHAAGERSDYQTAFCLAVESLLMLGMPTMIFFVCCAEDLVLALFGYGRFLPWDVAQTALCVRWMALSVPAIMVAKLLAASSFAQQNFRALMQASIAGVLVNAMVAWSLRDQWAQQAMAFAMIAGSWVNVSWLYYCAAPVSLRALWRRCRLFVWAIGWVFLAILIVMTKKMTGGVTSVDGGTARIISLAILAIPGGCVYVGLLWLMWRPYNARTHARRATAIEGRGANLQE